MTHLFRRNPSPIPYSLPTRAEAMHTLRALGDWSQAPGTYAKQTDLSDGIKVLRSPMVDQYDASMNKHTKEYIKLAKALEVVIGKNGWTAVPSEPVAGFNRAVRIEITNPGKIVELAPQLAAGLAIEEPRMPSFLMQEAQRRAAAKAAAKADNPLVCP